MGSIRQLARSQYYTSGNKDGISACRIASTYDTPVPISVSCCYALIGPQVELAVRFDLRGVFWFVLKELTDQGRTGLVCRLVLASQVLLSVNACQLRARLPGYSVG